MDSAGKYESFRRRVAALELVSGDNDEVWKSVDIDVGDRQDSSKAWSRAGQSEVRGLLYR